VIGLNNSKRIKNNNKSKYNAANPLRDTGYRYTPIQLTRRSNGSEYEGHSDDSDAEVSMRMYGF
jgi:hypothetical protein